MENPREHLPEKLPVEAGEARYTDESFWEKVKTHARRAGREVLEKALMLYYCLKDGDTPAWARTASRSRSRTRRRSRWTSRTGTSASGPTG